METINLCSCCLVNSSRKSLKTPYIYFGTTEVFLELLEECFQIQLTVDNEDGGGICEECEGRLRDASDFKRQVERCQAKMQARRARRDTIVLVKDEELPEMTVESVTCDETVSKEEPPEMIVESVTCDEPVSNEEPPAPSEAPVEDAIPEDAVISLSWSDTAGAVARLARRVSTRAKKQQATPCSVTLERLRSAHTCDKCPATFDQASSLTAHMETVHNIPFVPVSLSGTADAVARLARRVSPRVKKQQAATCPVRLERLRSAHACDKCPATFDQASSLTAHMETVHIPFVPVSLSGTAGAVARLARRVSTRAKKQQATTCSVRRERLRNAHACDKCPATFDQASSLTAHMETMHDHSFKADGEVFICDTCGKQCKRKLNLISHMKAHTKRSSKYTSNLNDFMVIIPGKKPYGCKICKKQFKAKFCLSRHTVVHTKLKSFKCDICNKMFTHKHDLTRHVITHTGKKPYNCKLCPKSFTQKNGLNQHMAVHTGLRPYVCPICYKTFTLKQLMANHIRIHTGQKPYKCEICKKSFTEKGQLRTHTRVHTGQKPYSCEICDRKFSQKIHVAFHQSRVHT